jgi:hypothetical protein
MFTGKSQDATRDLLGLQLAGGRNGQRAFSVGRGASAEEPPGLWPGFFTQGNP